MTPHYADDWLTVYAGDAREVLPELASDSVDCIVTSPPYFGLRDYGTATWSGGDAGCDHLENNWAGRGVGTLHGNPTDDAAQAKRSPMKATCRKCGATRQDSQLGLEATPEEYVANLVGVFRELRRVCKATATVWLNLGDSFMPGKQLAGIPWRVAFALQADGWVLRSEIIWSKPNPMPESVTDRPTKAHEQLFLFSKGKRVGPEPSRYDDIPEGEARWLAALFDGEGSLVCRREAGEGTDYGAHAAQVSIGGTSRVLLERIAAIVGEGNVLEREGQNAPMHYWQTSGKRALGLLRRIYPFLVVKQRQARCLISLEEGKRYPGGHERLAAAEIARREHIWQTVKSLNHFGDPDLSGIPEPVFGRWTAQPYYFDQEAVREAHTTPDGMGWAANGKGTRYSTSDYGTHRGAADFSRTDGLQAMGGHPNGRNLRSVWTIATRPYPGAHFAVFPPELPERCIKAGSSERGVCPECGVPWERVVERDTVFTRPGKVSKLGTTEQERRDQGRDTTVGLQFRPETSVTTTGWAPTCGCWLTPVPATILDPFAGSGTVGLVANRLSRRAILIDLNPAYLEQQMKRNAQVPVGL